MTEVMHFSMMEKVGFNGCFSDNYYCILSLSMSPFGVRARCRPISSIFALTMILHALSGSTAQPPFSYPSRIKLTFAILYTAIISMALVGNILVIYILYKRPETRRLTSFMYVNLAVADLLVTGVVMPQSMELIILDNLWIDGTFGELLAKLIMFDFFVAVTASLFSLTAVALDFFFGIVFP